MNNLMKLLKGWEHISVYFFIFLLKDVIFLHYDYIVKCCSFKKKINIVILSKLINSI